MAKQEPTKTGGCIAFFKGDGWGTRGVVGGILGVERLDEQTAVLRAVLREGGFLKSNGKLTIEKVGRGSTTCEVTRVTRNGQPATNAIAADLTGVEIHITGFNHQKLVTILDVNL